MRGQMQAWPGHEENTLTDAESRLTLPPGPVVPPAPVFERIGRQIYHIELTAAFEAAHRSV